jgi:UTP--glucose-1-phosphate uridylyltransferase
MLPRCSAVTTHPVSAHSKSRLGRRPTTLATVTRSSGRGQPPKCICTSPALESRATCRSLPPVKTGELAESLARLPPDIAAQLGEHRFEAAHLLDMAARYLAGEFAPRVVGDVAVPTPDDLYELPAATSEAGLRQVKRGEASLAAGEWALVVLAGGMATRMGGVVKALLEAVEGKSFLELRLGEQQALRRRAGRTVPLWLMTSAATDGPIRQALGLGLDGEGISIARQGLSLRLTPEGSLFYDDSGRPSTYAPGHGDLPEALRSSGLLERFVANGGRYLMITNLDNLGASLEPAYIGWFLEQQVSCACEVVDKLAADRGGIPVRVAGKAQVVEEYRLPSSFPPAMVEVFNTNTFHVSAREMLEAPLGLTWCAAHKTVSGRPTVQFERLLGEITAALPTHFLRVPRSGLGSRFLPVKDYDELQARRGEIASLVRARGWLAP